MGDPTQTHVLVAVDDANPGTVFDVSEVRDIIPGAIEQSDNNLQLFATDNSDENVDNPPEVDVHSDDSRVSEVGAEKPQRDEHEGEKTSERQTEPATSTAGKAEPKQKKPMKPKDRALQDAKRLGETLKKKITNLQEKLGDQCQVHFKFQFTCKEDKKVKQKLSIGDNFVMEGESAPVPVTQDNLSKVIESTFQKNLNPIVVALAKKTSPTPGTSSGGDDLSPMKVRSLTGRKTLEKICAICESSEVREHGIVYSSGWIGCSGTGEKSVPCDVWIHADCHGHAGASDADIKRMADWFCKNHRQDGRMKKNVQMTYQKRQSDTQDKPDDAGKKAKITPKSSKGAKK